jgi:hypothetical protein
MLIYTIVESRKGAQVLGLGVFLYCFYDAVYKIY